MGMTIDFAGRRALVTGAGKGIGRDIAKLLHDCGATVIALTRTAEDLESLAREMPCETITCDLADADEAREGAEKAGDVDLLVNNAGISILDPFLEAKVEDFDRTIAVNVRAMMLVTQVVAKNMIARGVNGVIVNLSSVGSKVGIPDHTGYCASKGAVDQLTRVMATELGQHGIRVNAINPTVTLTPMGEMAWGDPAKSEPVLARIPVGRFAQPIDVAYVVAFLLSEYSAMVDAVTLPVDGGFLAT
jgi:NAD(P)-dependent dehydrogenase (short-subunit alcohol dehydrogenase family)